MIFRDPGRMIHLLRDEWISLVKGQGLLLLLFLVSTVCAAMLLFPAFSNSDAIAEQETPTPEIAEIASEINVPDQTLSAEKVLADKAKMQLLPDRAKVDPSNLTRLEFTIRGGLGNSVWREIMRLWGPQPDDDSGFLDRDSYAGYVYRLIDRITMWWFDIEHDYAEGDRITVLLEPYIDPEKDWLLRIVALDYQGANGHKRAYYFEESEREWGAHYDLDGYELALHILPSPLEDWQEIVATWGDRRRHKGIDYKVPRFTPIYAPMAGTITRINWRTRSNGNCLQLVSTDGTRVMKFLHLEKFPKSVYEGKKVKIGDFIGYTGNTGHSYGPHLHFQLELTGGVVLDKNGEPLEQAPVDPLIAMPSCAYQLPDEEMELFTAKVAAYDKLLFPEKAGEPHIVKPQNP